MWICPECQQKFVNLNQWHSCNQNTIEHFLEGKTEDTLRLYQLLIDEFKCIGEFELHPAKTRIALNSRMRFASINRLGDKYLAGHLVLNRRYDETACFHRIETVTKSAHVHHFKLCHKEDINQELIHYMRMAYQLGQ